MKLLKSRYQTQSKPQTPEIQNKTTLLPPNQQTFKLNFLSGSGFVAYK